MSAPPDRLVLLGHPVAHSLSPAFQNAALQAAGISARYDALDVPPGLLQVTLDDAKTGRWAGNVTVPHKQAVYARCSELTAVATRAGAVNAFRASPDGIVGHNTDVAGFANAIRQLLGADPENLVFGVIGAGGSAAAVLTALESWRGCKAIVANRSKNHLDALVARFSSVARAGDVAAIARQANVVVNATSLGLRATDPLPIDPAALGADVAVFDLVYSAGQTRLVREAGGRGLRAADGMSMLVGQGAAAFEWWFGFPPDLRVIWRTLGRPLP